MTEQSTGHVQVKHVFSVYGSFIYIFATDVGFTSNYTPGINRLSLAGWARSLNFGHP